MDEDAELGILVPLRNFIVTQTFPIGAEGAVVSLAVCFLEQRVALGVVFGDGLLPLQINLGCGFVVVRGGEGVWRGLRRQHGCGEQEEQEGQSAGGSS